MAAQAPIQRLDAPGAKAEGSNLSALRRQVASLVKLGPSQFPGAQPVSFARKHLEELRKTECGPYKIESPFSR
jgi:mRNA guanylyltransferase